MWLALVGVIVARSVSAATVPRAIPDAELATISVTRVPERVFVMDGTVNIELSTYSRDFSDFFVCKHFVERCSEKKLCSGPILSAAVGFIGYGQVYIGGQRKWQQPNARSYEYFIGRSLSRVFHETLDLVSPIGIPILGNTVSSDKADIRSQLALGGLSIVSMVWRSR
jgi:hypothetical protein